MSYLPSSRLYEREPEKAPAAPPPAAAPAPKPAAPRRATMMPKEWLVAPKPVLPTSVAPPDPVLVVAPPANTMAAAAPLAAAPAPEGPVRKRNIFHKAHKVVLRHLDRAKNPAQEPEPDLLWFAVMVIGSVSMGLMIWGAYSALPRFGAFRPPFPADASARRVKVPNDVLGQWVHDHHPVHLESHGSPPAPPLMAPMSHPVAPHAMLPVAPMPIAVPHPPLNLPVHDPRIHEPQAHVPIEPPLDPLPERKEPSVFLHANRGDTPMIRTWNELAKTTMLLTALTAVPMNHALAGLPAVHPQADNEEIKALAQQVKALSEKIDKMTKLEDAIKALKAEFNDKIANIKVEVPKVDNSTELTQINTRLAHLERQLDLLVKNPMPGAIAPAPVGNANLGPIQNQLDKIEQAIRGLQPVEKRISLAPPEALAVKPATALVILVNLYNEDLSLWVNQKPYRVPAGKTYTVPDVPVGPTTIQVRSLEGSVFYTVNPTLVASETHTLTALK
jgi:hypothetical protein